MKFLPCIRILRGSTACYRKCRRKIILLLINCKELIFDLIFPGHILFEMCAGYELCTPQPNQGHLLDLKNYPQVGVSKYLVSEEIYVFVCSFM
jgi:hypothetical protein